MLKTLLKKLVLAVSAVMCLCLSNTYASVDDAWNLVFSGDFTAARQELLSVIADDPEDYDAILNMAVLDSFYLGDKTTAIDAFVRILSESRSELLRKKAVCSIASLYVEDKNYQQAEEMVVKELESGEFAQGLTLLAALASDYRKDLEFALECQRKAVDMSPTAGNYIRLAYYLSKNGQLAEARTFFSRAQKLDEQGDLYYRAKYYVLHGKLSEAKRDVQMILASNVSQKRRKQLERIIKDDFDLKVVFTF